MADKDPHFHRRDFCSLMRNGRWTAGFQRVHAGGIGQ
jgi:hypothetical protein